MSRAGMPSPFVFLAVRTGGGRTMGLRRAASRGALAAALRRERLLLLRSWQLPAWIGSRSRTTTLGLKTQAELNDVLAQLLARGVPLVEALDVTANAVGPAARDRVARLRDLVAAGSSFSDACAAVGGFDTVTIAVYRAAERTGDLAGSARQLASTARRQLAVTGKAATLMIYPVIVLSISVIVSVGMLVGIVPTLGAALQDLGGELPVYSRIVMGLGTWMREWILALALGLAVVLGVALVAWRPLLALVQRLMRRVPLVGSVVLAQETTRFFAVMGAMTRSGVPLADALAVSNQAIGHPRLRAQLERLRTRLVEGGVLRTLIEEVTALPLATRRLLIAAERAGDLETAFSGLAQDMSDEVEKRSARLLAALEPLLIVVMFVMIGSLIAAIMIPIITASSRIR